MAYRTWRRWQKRGGSYIKKIITAAEQTWLGSDVIVGVKRKQDCSHNNSSRSNMDVWHRLRQGGSNGCANTVAERTWLGSSVRNCNSSSDTALTVDVRTWLTGSGGREATDTSRQQRRQKSKLGLAVTAGRRQSNSETAMTATAAAKI